MPRPLLRPALLLAPLLAALLAGCATPASVAPGQPEAEVLRELGKPTSRSVTPGVGPRLLYSRQPFGLEVWALQFDAAGRLISSAQMLTPVQFAKVQPGTQTRADIERRFGPPAQTFHFALIDQDAWMYRFLQDGFFKMAFWVQFTPQGVVTETGITTDPWSERDSDRAP